MCNSDFFEFLTKLVNIATKYFWLKVTVSDITYTDRVIWFFRFLSNPIF